MSANYEQLQEDIAAKLLSEELLQRVNVLTLRKMQAVSEVNAELIWSTPRVDQSRAGAGILIGMPTFSYPVPNVPGPERDLLVPISVFEHPIINQHPDNGTLLTAEQITDYVDAILARFLFSYLNTVVTTRSSKPNTDVAGVIRYDTLLQCTVPRSQVETCNRPSIDSASVPAAVTITNNEPGSDILYTTDGTFPARDAATGNLLGTTQIYTGAFAVDAGTWVRCWSFLSGKAGSDEESGEINP